MDRLHSAMGATIVALVVALVGAAFLPATASAEPFANDSFQTTWERTDQPVSDLDVSRTWIWGPEAFTTGILEPYDEAPNGQRMVQYFDKTRMEITTDPNVGRDSVWYVTNGLLATELISGELQLGNDRFESYAPAEINIAGDPVDESAPTYVSFNRLLDLQTFELGSMIGATVDRDGVVGQNPSMLDYGVTASVYVQETDHTVASVFWDFMTSEGTIYQNGELTYGALFDNAFFATGFPITEAYWDTILVAGARQDVLIQAFERRVLTYTPSNQEGWQVEAGNVGRHYHEWRYEIIPASPDPEPTPPPATPAPLPPITPPTDPVPDPTPPPVSVPAADRGTIGEAGTEPLGEDEISPAAEPYFDVEVSPFMPEMVVSTASRPTAVNQQKNVSLYIEGSLSGKVYFVVDYNDGSVFVSPVIGANVGINAPHTWSDRGTYYGKAWAIDPISGMRSEVTEFTVVIE
ncbi:hypothetical protein BH23CHL1_BH23CHL1_17070 [soil metagenome]